MLKYIESFYLSVGRYSCYFDCLVRIAEKEMEKRGFNVQYDHNTLVQICSFNKVNGRQWITFDWNDYSNSANFDVNYPTKILNILTGLEWDMKRIDTADYKPKSNEYDIRRLGRDGVDGFHFNMEDYDPLQNSQTAKYGKVNGHRVFFVKE